MTNAGRLEGGGNGLLGRGDGARRAEDEEGEKSDVAGGEQRGSGHAAAAEAGDKGGARTNIRADCVSDVRHHVSPPEEGGNRALLGWLRHC